MKKLLTGSRVYGTPRDDSDQDVIILCDQETSDLLAELIPAYPYATAYGGLSMCLLDTRPAVHVNYIVTTDPSIFDQWVRAKALCMAEAPITRDRALEIHTEIGI